MTGPATWPRCWPTTGSSRLSAAAGLRDGARLRPGFFPRILRSLELVVVGGTGLLFTTFLSGAITGAGSFGFALGLGIRILAAVVVMVLDTALFVVLFNRLTVRDVGWRASLPGAAFAAVCWYLLQVLGTP
jgi:uncharacterized BrkB/YihY/UPF0761 family membrane protein